MKILFINTFFEGGGAEKVSRQLFYHFRQQDNVEVFYLAGKGNGKTEVDCIYYVNTMQYFMNRGMCFLSNNQRKRDRYALKKIVKIIKDKQIDIVHFHNIHGNYMGFEDILEIAQRCKIVWTLHDMWALTGHCAHAIECKQWEDGCRACGQKWIYPRIRRNVAKRIYQNKKKIFAGNGINYVVPSEWLADVCRKGILCKEKVKVIHNGVNISVFQEHNREKLYAKYQIDKNKIILMFVSNQLENSFKGITTLIKALDVLKNKADYAILICGNGNDLPISEEFEIHHMGYIKRDAVMSELYSAADVFIIPSVAENYPCTVMESIASGTPVIGSDAGGIPEQIQKETGWIFPRGNYMELADLIEGLSKEQLASMRKTCRNVAEMYFSEEKMFKEYQNLYERVIQNEVYTE